MEKWRRKFHRHHSLDNIQPEELGRAKDIVERFKVKHGALMELDPEIGVDQYVTDADGNSCNKLMLFVGHRFIFDYRRIPSHFEGIEVKSHLCEEMPREFPPYFPGMQAEAYHSKERYLTFVGKNLAEIRKKLKSNNITTNEALDAISGGWTNHLNWLNKQKEKKLMENKEHIEFFNNLLRKTSDAFNNSDVKKEYGYKNWGYSVTATSFKKQAKIIAGFNWGVDKKWIADGNSYGPQKEYPLKNFSSLYEELGSLKRTVKSFHNYFDVIPEVQINYCFFRSETEEQISPGDLELSDKLFDELLEYLEPSMVISFSRSLNKHFLNSHKLLNISTKQIPSAKNSIVVTKGQLLIGKNKVDYFNLPHPNFPVTADGRKKAWDFCFADNDTH